MGLVNDLLAAFGLAKNPTQKLCEKSGINYADYARKENSTMIGKHTYLVAVVSSFEHFDRTVANTFRTIEAFADTKEEAYQYAKKYTNSYDTILFITRLDEE